jgi:hypothetical protein
MATGKITRDELLSLEDYSRQRAELRQKVMAHKAKRRAHIGKHATLSFEDRLTMQYQVQEMLRVEKIFEDEGIEEELASYNPLIPDGDNWKATLMIEYPDPSDRAQHLSRLIGVEDRVWVKVGGHDRVYPIADEDLERETEEKTSSVHFLRWQLTPAMISALKGGDSLSIGIDHEHYREALEPVPDHLRATLLEDLA